MSDLKAMEKLYRIMACLRDPQRGCPWDLEQTPASLTAHTLEEVYEVVDAIESGTPGKLKDELGDLLFQIYFYSRIAEEAGQFDLNGVAEAICAKLLRRHPHVFPDGTLASFGQPQTIDAARVASNWEAIKRQEREAQGSEATPVSILSDVPAALPALVRAAKLQRRAATVGFDWEHAAQVLDKLREEITELQAELEKSAEQVVGDIGEAGESGKGGKSGMNGKVGTNELAVREEVGDVLFAMVNLARHLGIEAESALRAANNKFARRFEFIETTLREQGLAVDDAGLERLEQLWHTAKQNGL